MESAHVTQACCLIVDDEPAVAEALAYVLKRAGWRTASVGRGDDALAWLTRDRCDVIVLDLQLPDINGIDLLRHLRAQPATAATPVLVMTAGSARTDRQTALDAGATLFMPKPFSVAAMLATIESAARQGARGA